MFNKYTFSFKTSLYFFKNINLLKKNSFLKLTLMTVDFYASFKILHVVRESKYGKKKKCTHLTRIHLALKGRLRFKKY